MEKLIQKALTQFPEKVTETYSLDSLNEQEDFYLSEDELHVIILTKYEANSNTILLIKFPFLFLILFFRI